jgi:hypothetical protein
MPWFAVSYVRDTLKLEEIHGTLYSVACDILYRRHHPRGTSRRFIEIIYSGVLLFLLLLLIIFGPLLLFSTANPVSQNNLVSSTSISLSLSGTQGEYPLVDVTSFTISGITDADYVLLQNEDLLQDGDDSDAVQVIQLANYSDHVWDISPPALDQLMFSLNDVTEPMSVKFEYSFTRASGPQNDKVISGTLTTPLPQPVQTKLAQILHQTVTAKAMDSQTLSRASQPPASKKISRPFGSFPPFLHSVLTQNGSSNSSVLLPAAAPLYLRLPATSDPMELDPNQRNDILLTVGATQEQSGAIRWWLINEMDGLNPTSIQFVTVSNRIFAVSGTRSASSACAIIGFRVDPLDFPLWLFRLFLVLFSGSLIQSELQHRFRVHHHPLHRRPVCASPFR